MARSRLGESLLAAALAIYALSLIAPALYAYLVTAGIIAMALGIAFVFGYDVFWFARNRLSPTVRVHARVIRKRHKQRDVSLQGETPAMAAARLGMLGRNPEEAAQARSRAAETAEDVPEVIFAQGADCYVTFAFEGREMEFFVAADIYVAVDEGTEGLLVFQGEKIKHFIRGI